MIDIQKLKEKLNQFRDTDEISCCTCGEELLVFRDGRKIAEIKTVE